MSKKCDICSRRKSDVMTCCPVWSAWGRNAFDFNWCKIDHGKMLCEDCERENYEPCEDCGALMAYPYAWIGLPEDAINLYCPDCAEKHGVDVTYGVGNPGWISSAK